MKITTLEFFKVSGNGIILGEVTISRTGTRVGLKVTTVDFLKVSFNGIIVGVVIMSRTET